MSIESIGLPYEKVNLNGSVKFSIVLPKKGKKLTAIYRRGAIAFGHPLGATGARQVVSHLEPYNKGTSSLRYLIQATGFAVAKRTKTKLFVTSMCIGSGMGMAALFVNEA